MKKTIILSALLAAALLLCACGDKPQEIDAGALAQELYEKVTFADELSPAPDGAAERLYSISNAENACIYIGSGATAEEIAVFEFADESSAKQALELAQARIEKQREDYASYIPEEVKKLDNALAERNGNYVVVCVAEGGEAEEIVSAYFK